MKKFYKHLGIVFVMAFAIIIGCLSNNVFAADDGVIGTVNLNNTVENSAKVGDQLFQPEKGWKRYDDNDTRIQHIGTWYTDTCSSEWKGNVYYARTDNNTIKFKFYGTKIRLIAAYNVGQSSKVQVTVDGESKVHSCLGELRYSILVEQFTNLDLGMHDVSITSLSNGDWQMDALDIDKDGYLVDPSTDVLTGITLNKATDTLQVGQTDALTATVTPDNVTNKNVTWKSSDESIATVDQTGKVTAKKEGTATITATTQDGSNLSASCVVTVTPQGITPTNPTDNTGNAILTLAMTNGNIKSYTVSMSKVNDFISWYNNRSAGSNGSPYYTFDKTDNLQPFSKKTEYIVFDKISSFEVDEYAKQ